MSTVRLPAGPRGHFLSGHLPDLVRDPVGFLTMCAREYGDFVPLRFGVKRTFFLNHPSYIESMLVANRDHFIKGPVVRSAGRLYGNGLFLSEGECWRYQRSVAQPAFHPACAAAGAGAMVAHAERMLASWQNGEVRDVQHDMLCLMLAIAAETLFGADISARAAEFVDALMDALRLVAARVQSLAFLLPDTVPTPANLQLRRAVQRLDAVVADIIAQRRACVQDRGDLLSMLLHADDTGGSGPVTARQLRDDVMNFLLAGHESSAVALSWTWHLLAEHPDVESRLVAELEGVLNGRPPGAADVPQLRYTERVILESMRLYPPVPLLGREAIHDCEIGGFHVRRGALVVASEWVMHRDPRYFEEPEVFNPERWGNGGLDRLPRYVFFPFGGGPRVCLGRSFAMMELTLVLATIAQNVSLARVAEHPIVPLASSSLFAKHGMRMRLTRRTQRRLTR